MDISKLHTTILVSFLCIYQRIGKEKKEKKILVRILLERPVAVCFSFLFFLPMNLEVKKENFIRAKKYLPAEEEENEIKNNLPPTLSAFDEKKKSSCG